MMGNRPKSLGSDPRSPLWLLLVLAVIGIVVVVILVRAGVEGVSL